MSRLSALLVFLFALLSVAGYAQRRPPGSTGSIWGGEIIGESSGSFTVSVRLIGDAKVTFRDIGTIESTLDSGDRFGAITRAYHDGFVQRDQRTTVDGTLLADTGFTSSWSMLNDSQVLPDQSAIAFHNYSTLANGSSIDAESGRKPGWDMELSRRFGGFGKRLKDNRRAGSWGVFGGLGLTDINAKTTGKINATRRSITDFYSLDGANPPTAPYTAPSTETVTVIGADGVETSIVINNTTLLANQPYERTVTDEPDGAEIDGFWQVKGTYFSVRAGLWSRWHISRQLSVRASAGMSFHLLGVDMRYDEKVDSTAFAADIAAKEQGKSENYTGVGVFGSLDVEFWLTRRTGFFGSLTYDGLSSDIGLTLGGRRADVQLASGMGFRLGLTTLF